jgi:ribosomal protein L11 methyltransferase
VLEPKEAFGTGHHATTRLLLEWLEDLYESGRGAGRVLDLGSGSGILAMVALRLGADRVLGIDSDPDAIRCAREYAVANRFGPELELRLVPLRDLAVEELASDLVTANLDRRTILDSVPVFARILQEDVSLLLSGLLSEDREDIATAFSAVGAVVAESREQDGWLALEMTMRPKAFSDQARDDEPVEP